MNETSRLVGTHREKQHELEHVGHKIDDKTLLIYVMASLPHEEYQATISTLKAKLREESLSSEEAETLLDDK